MPAKRYGRRGLRGEAAPTAARPRAVPRPAPAPRLALAGVLCALAGAGCGDDGSGVAQPADVAGAWSLDSEVSGAGLTCQLSTLSILLTQAEDSLAATTLGGAFPCSPSGEELVFLEGGSGPGTVRGRRVDFTIPMGSGAALDAAGELSGGAISGETTLRVDLGSDLGFVDMAGDFRMTRVETP